MNAWLAAILTVGAAVSMAPHLRRPLPWTPDGLFYQANLLRVRGASREAALRSVFDGPIASYWRRREAGLKPQEREVSRPAWVRYSARFYERRWVVPILGAAIYPVFGSGSLHVVSVLAYAVFAGALFLLLRSRFSVLPSLAATVVVAALPPLRLWGHLPLTDTPALLLLVAGFAAARLALVRGSLWLLVWCLVVLAITFTRDTAIVVITAAAWLALRAPSRRAAAVAVTGAVAALPAAAFLGGSWRETLAYTFNDHRPPRDHSWHFVWKHYWPSLERLLRQEWAFLSANPEVGLVCGAGLLSLFLLRTRPDDRFLPMQRAGVIGGLAFLVLLPYFSRFRFELVFLPGVATGLAAGAERLSEIGRGQRQSGRHER